MELIPTILDQLHSEVIVKTALSAAKLERWLEIPFHKLFVLAATGNSWFVGNSYLGIPSCLPVIHPRLRRLAIATLPKRLHCGSQTQP